MGTPIKVVKGNKAVKALLAATFPEYKGRKVSVEVAEKVYFDVNGGGGTWDEVKAVKVTGEVASVPRLAPWTDGAAALQSGVAGAMPEGRLWLMLDNAKGVPASERNSALTRTHAAMLAAKLPEEHPMWEQLHDAYGAF